MTNVKKLDNKNLINKIRFLISEEKKNIAAQIVILKEIRSRKLAISLGYPNLITFCQEELGLSRDQAWKRSQAAGAVEKEPELLNLLKTGQTSTSTLAVIAPKLNNLTVQEIKEFIPKKSKREVEAFISNLNRDGTRSQKPQTIKLQLEVTLKTADLLKRARKILKQNQVEVSDDDLIKSAFELLLNKKDPQRRALRQTTKVVHKKNKHIKQVKPNTPAPGQSKNNSKQIVAKSRSRYIPARTRHKIHSSTRYQCEFKGTAGKQCSETTALQIDHKKMFCHGGGHEVENLRLLCSTHNRYLAEKALGISSLRT